MPTGLKYASVARCLPELYQDIACWGGIVSHRRSKDADTAVSRSARPPLGGMHYYPLKEYNPLTAVGAPTGGSGMAKDKVEYWSRTSPTYDTSEDTSLGGNTRPLVNELLKKEKELGAVVEFGCGTGYFTKTLAERAQSVIATDFSDDMLRIAGEHVRGCSNVRFGNVDGQNTPFADASFDTGFSGFVIPCVDDKLQALRESSRILKPGGRLIIANPNLLLLPRPGLATFLLQALIAWRGRLPPVSFCSVQDLIEGTGFTPAGMHVVRGTLLSHRVPRRVRHTG